MGKSLVSCFFDPQCTNYIRTPKKRNVTEASDISTRNRTKNELF